MSDTENYTGENAATTETQPRRLTLAQLTVVGEYVDLHELDESQISFEGDNPSPIFDYEAVNALSLKLTDIQDVECLISERNSDESIVSATCKITLPDGRTRSVEASAEVGESYGGAGKTIDSMRLAEAVARSRASRLGIRSVGINLHRAHEAWKKSGKSAVGHTRNDPRKPIYDELHANAEKAGFIINGNKSAYQDFIAENYDGRTSAKDLDDLELNRLNVTMRSFARLKNIAPQQKEAA